MIKAPAGMRPGSLYHTAYYSVRQPLLAILLEGVRWDAETAKGERERLVERRERIKDELDGITGTHRLYAVRSRTSDEFLQLRELQRELKAQYGEIPKGDRAARKDARTVLSGLRDALADCRAEGRGKVYTKGDGLSDKEIGKFLFGILGLPEFRKKRKSTGKITVTVDDLTLKKIRLRWPEHEALTNLILEHRRCVKLCSTYLNPERLLNPIDGRFHSHYKPHGTQTLRLSSSSDPWDFGGNSQNQDRKFKWLFLPDE